MSEPVLSNIEKLLQGLMLIIGSVGLVVIYGGFLYLLFAGFSTEHIAWYYLLSPWVCIFYGLNGQQQGKVIAWFKVKFSSKSQQKL